MVGNVLRKSWKFLIKIQWKYIFFYNFWKIVATNRTFDNNIKFLQHFYKFLQRTVQTGSGQGELTNGMVGDLVQWPKVVMDEVGAGFRTLLMEKNREVIELGLDTLRTKLAQLRQEVATTDKRVRMLEVLTVGSRTILESERACCPLSQIC